MFQFMLPGAASIYYGDEAAVEGVLGTNEGCRYPMPWGKDFQSGELYRLNRTMAQMKAKHPALSRGGMKFLYAQGNVIALARFWEEEVYVTVLSTEDQDRKIRLPLGAVGAQIPEQEIFGKALEFVQIDDKSIELTVKAHQAYFMACRMK